MTGSGLVTVAGCGRDGERGAARVMGFVKMFWQLLAWIAFWFVVLSAAIEYFGW